MRVACLLRFLAKETGVLAGLKVADVVFEMVDPRVVVEWTMADGDRVTKGTYFGTVKGKCRASTLQTHTSTSDHTHEHTSTPHHQSVMNPYFFPTGAARSLLVGERIALNLMQRMSGVATLTRSMVDKVPADSPTRILDTRKTMPGLRVLDKAAVLLGGGTNHRMGLHDMVMIKDNHITAAGSLKEAVARVLTYLV
jgi:nicotinate-nucleotide pyrophosphorylase (carboxylating)